MEYKVMDLSTGEITGETSSPNTNESLLLQFVEITGYFYLSKDLQLKLLKNI